MLTSGKGKNEVAKGMLTKAMIEYGGYLKSQENQRTSGKRELFPTERGKSDMEPAKGYDLVSFAEIQTRRVAFQQTPGLKC